MLSKYLKNILLAAVLVFITAPFAQAACPDADFSADCKVSLPDLAVLADNWLTDPPCAGTGCPDLIADNMVDMVDFAALANQWTVDCSGLALYINEFMADNEDFIADDYNESDDWIEIYNAEPFPVNVAAMFLTDDLNEPAKWQIPSDNPEKTTINPGAFLLIWADGQPEQGTLHAPFKLYAASEEIELRDYCQNPIDSLTFTLQGEDESLGRLPDGSDTWQVFTTETLPPTPGLTNTGIDHQILISEIMYHSSTDPDSDTYDYIELYNTGPDPVNLFNWHFSDGVDFIFPDITIDPCEYLVIADDLTNFSIKYPAVTNVIGSWNGRLRHSGEKIELRNASDTVIDLLRYADEGNWSRRQQGPLDNNHYGWVWSDAHDGLGKSLELINPDLANKYGQNWAASLTPGGTPGTENTVIDYDIAPFILDVEHFPPVPTSAEPVWVTAEILDRLKTGLTVTLHYRIDGQAQFNNLTMFDDALHGDGGANDGTYGVTLPPHADGTVIEFYIQAEGSTGKSRTWPAPVETLGQLANLLYQVNDAFSPDPLLDNQPTYYIIMTEAERAELAYIGSHEPDRHSNAQMNATFISVEPNDIKIRYTVGVRNRGHGSRKEPPNNYRVNFAHDRKWHGVEAININARYGYLQLIGSTIFQLAGLPAADAKMVQLRVNGQNRAMPTFYGMFDSYVHMEVLDTDFVKDNFPDDSQGNLYKCMRVVSPGADLHYEDDFDTYYDNYIKLTNEELDDYYDLMYLTNVLCNQDWSPYMVSLRADLDQWLRYLALNALLINVETGLYTGEGDDYVLYRGITDWRFHLIPHDLDTIFNQAYNTAPIDKSIFDYSPVAGLYNIMTSSSTRSLYYQAYRDLLDNLFNPQVLNPVLDEKLSGFVPQRYINAMKQFIIDRAAAVEAQLP